MLLATAVHTAGVNIELVLTIVGSIVLIMTAILGFFARWIADRITSAIDRFRIDVIVQLDTRLTVLETVANATAATTTATRKRQTRDD